MTAILSLVPRWVWAALVAALAATSCKLTIDLGSVKLELEKAKVAMAEQEAAYESARANAAETLAAAQARARQAEQDTIKVAATIREESNAQILAANAVADSLRERVRNARAEAFTRTYSAAVMPRSTTVAAAPETPVVSDEPVVLGTIGEQDVDEAERAETIRVELLGCYRQYDEARSRLEAMK